VAGAGDARTLVDVEPDVAFLGQQRLSRVEPHPYPDWPAQECALGLHDRADRFRRSREGDKERVALGVDLHSVMSREGRAEHPAVLVKLLGVRITDLAQQLRRALDVGEEQGDHAGREITRHARIMIPELRQRGLRHETLGADP